MEALRSPKEPTMFAEYTGIYRHWHPDSEKCTGGDSLATALREGWEIDTSCEEHNYRRGRSVIVYHFGLRRGKEAMTMPVIHNPYVDFLLNDLRRQSIPGRERVKSGVTA
jgi:hypothetical protein